MAETNSTAQLVNKLNEASKKIKAVRKDGQNSFQRYSFQSEAAIKSAVKAAIESVGIVITPSYEITDQRDIHNSKGHVAHIVDVIGTFTITDGISSLIGKMPGSGMDTGEKATAKACTSAQKYFYKQLFNISDRDEDPDTTDSNMAQPRQPQRPANNRRRPAQRQQLSGPDTSRLKEEYNNLVAQIAVKNQTLNKDVNKGITETLKNNKQYQAMDELHKIQKAIQVAKNMLGGNN